MGQFKPMVKMETTEPSVILKLKKGGTVKGFKNTKMHSAEHGHKKMADGGSLSALLGSPALVGRPAVNAPVRSPGKPTMAERRKAMAMKGQKMPPKAMPSERGMPEAAMKGTAPGGMPPGMKKGGKAEGGETPAMHKAEMKKMSKLEGELKSHEGKPASKAHKGLKTGGVVKGNGGGYKTGGVAKGNGGGYAAGGAPRITSDKAPVMMKPSAPMRGFSTSTPTSMGMIKPTPYGKTMGRKTGGVVNGQGGYCEGGSSKKGYATGGKVDSGKPVAMPQGNKKPSPPATQVNLSGTYKGGGKVKKKEANVAVLAKGGSAPQKGRTRPKKMAEGGDLLQNANSASRSFLEKANAASQRTTGKTLIPTAAEIAAQKADLQAKFAAQAKSFQQTPQYAQQQKALEAKRVAVSQPDPQTRNYVQPRNTTAAPYEMPSYMSYNTANRSNLSGSTYSPYSGTTVSNRYSQPQVTAYKPGTDYNAWLLSGNAPVMKATYRAKGGSTTKKPVKMAAGGSFLQKAITASQLPKSTLDTSKLYPTTQPDPEASVQPTPGTVQAPPVTVEPSINPIGRAGTGITTAPEYTPPVSKPVVATPAPVYKPAPAPVYKPAPTPVYTPVWKPTPPPPKEAPKATTTSFNGYPSVTAYNLAQMGVKTVPNIYPSSSGLYGNYTPTKKVY